MSLQAVLDASVLLSIFKRKGGPGQFTKEFDNLAPDKREMLMNTVLLRPSEIAVLASSAGDDYWSLITNMRVVVYDHNKVIEFPISSISEVVPKLEPSKRKYHTLVVHNFEGVDYKLEIESGMPFSGIWNVLKRVAVVNCRKRKEEKEEGSSD